MRRKDTLILLLIIVLLSSCCSKKVLFTADRPMVYKLIDQKRISFTTKRISIFKEEHIKHARPMDSTHFIYRNFETYYVFATDKSIKRLELRNYKASDVAFNYKNEFGDIGHYTACFTKIGSEKLTLEKKGLDTIVLTDANRSLEHILLRVKGN